MHPAQIAIRTTIEDFFSYRLRPETAINRDGSLWSISCHGCSTVSVNHDNFISYALSILQQRTCTFKQLHEKIIQHDIRLAQQQYILVYINSL